MPKKIDHIGIATKSIADALDFYTKGLGMTLEHEEEVPEQMVKTAFFPVGDVHVELLEPTSDDSPIAKFIEKKGAGIHHICYEVDDIEAALANLSDQGFQLIDKAPRKGAHGKLIAFIHPKSTGGILVELAQASK